MAASGVCCLAIWRRTGGDVRSLSCDKEGEDGEHQKQEVVDRRCDGVAGCEVFADCEAAEGEDEGEFCTQQQDERDAPHGESAGWCGWEAETEDCPAGGCDVEGTRIVQAAPPENRNRVRTNRSSSPEP